MGIKRNCNSWRQPRGEQWDDNKASQEIYLESLEFASAYASHLQLDSLGA